MFSTCLCTEITLSFSRSLPSTHSTDTHSRTETCQRCPCKFINEIISQLKRYMTFLSSEVLEAVQFKDSLLVDSAAEHCWETHRRWYSRSLSLSLSLSLITALMTALACISMAQASVISSKMTFWNLQKFQKVRKKLVQHTQDFRTETWQMSLGK